MGSISPVAVVKRCRVAPPPGTVAGKSISLTFYDIPYLFSGHIPQLLFFDFPHSKSHFLNEVLPGLENSLSLTLQHFCPFAGSLLLPVNRTGFSDDHKPILRYSDGDSVPLTVVESDQDFNYLTGYFPRQADKFYSLIPEFPRAITEDDVVKCPLLSLQITLFPNHGICIGFAIHHIGADVGSVRNFMKFWSSVAKFGFDDPKMLTPPLYDRGVIKDPYGLEKIYLNQLGDVKLTENKYFPTPDRVRNTFILRRADVLRLRTSVLAKNPSLHASTFAITCAYVWICMLKSRVVKRKDDDVECFAFPIDPRSRLEPPIPDNYFGNCVIMCYTEELRKPTTSQLVGEGGLEIAVGLIGDCIMERVRNPETVLKGLEKRLEVYKELETSYGRVAVGGSTKANFYEADFGWGKPKRNEIVIDSVENAFTITRGRGFEEDLEIGVCFPRIRMNSFATIFVEGLKNL